MEACEESLTALGVPCIDLREFFIRGEDEVSWELILLRSVYIHSVNTNTPIEETMRALKELQE